MTFLHYLFLHIIMTIVHICYLAYFVITLFYTSTGGTDLGYSLVLPIYSFVFWLIYLSLYLVTVQKVKKKLIMRILFIFNLIVSLFVFKLFYVGG